MHKGVKEVGIKERDENGEKKSWKRVSDQSFDNYNINIMTTYLLRRRNRQLLFSFLLENDLQ